MKEQNGSINMTRTEIDRRNFQQQLHRMKEQNGSIIMTRAEIDRAVDSYAQKVAQLDAHMRTIDYDTLSVFDRINYENEYMNKLRNTPVTTK